MFRQLSKEYRLTSFQKCRKGNFAPIINFILYNEIPAVNNYIGTCCQFYLFFNQKSGCSKMPTLQTRLSIKRRVPLNLSFDKIAKKNYRTCPVYILKPEICIYSVWHFKNIF